MERKLIIVYENQVIGIISESSDTFSFKYEDAWIQNPSSFDISPHFKRVKKNHRGVEVKNFLENLLPEEGNRKTIASTNKIDTKDIMSLLQITGRDSAGALQIYSEEEFKSLKYAPDEVYKISIAELAEKIKKNGSVINFITNIGLKPSLSGAQDKIACRYNKSNGEVSFPTASGATTHILKPNNITNEKKYKSLEKSALNELISLRLADKILKKIPKTYFVESKSRDIFIIERYDRLIIGNKIKRIHQLDFCQYFGLGSTDKYEVSLSGTKKGHYGIKEIIEAIRDVSEEPSDVEKVLDWVVFNYLIENTDSHLKNISIIATDTGFKLAPFYDITSVGFYKDAGVFLFDNHFAFDIGGESKLSDICDIQWKKFAIQLGFAQDYFLIKIRDMSHKISQNLKSLYQQLKNDIKDPVNLSNAGKIIKYIVKSMEEKSYRCLVNTNLKTKKTTCSVCEKPLSKRSVLSIGPECLSKYE